MNTTSTQSADPKIAVIGAGAAGLMAAGTALSFGAEVVLFEHSDRPGRKLAITGKGRCNVTNDSGRDEFLENVPRNPRFLYAALSAFSTEDTKTFFESLGVPLKVERGKRVFPVSDHASDIVDALKSYASGAEIRYENVKDVKANDDGSFSVLTEDKAYTFAAVIVATGGRSYPQTGSDGSGHRIARKLGHTVTKLTPSLVPLTSPDPICPTLMGLSLRNVAVRFQNGAGRVLYTDFGEMLFTHFGVTGPVVLSGSAHLGKEVLDGVTLSIDLKPALDEKTLDERILSDFRERSNKDVANALDALLPQKLREPVIDRAGIDPRKKVRDVTREERLVLLSVLKNFTIPIDGFRPIEEAIVTSGGVSVDEIVPKSMMSKIHPGLFFAGEILDVDAYTGGFNLQIAFSTAYLAGKSSAEFVS